MVMVDTLEKHEENFSVSSFLLDSNNIFCKDGFLLEPGLIENIAQTAALRAGYTASLTGDEVKKGFIGSVKRLKIYDLPAVNTRLRTKVTVLNQVMNAAIIKGEVHADGRLLVACEMTIFTDE